MNAAEFHLAVNHFPLVGLIIAVLVLLAGFITRNKSIRRTGLAIVVFSSIFAVIAFLSGDGAEEIAEHLPGVSHEVIEEHEENAVLFFWMMITIGVLSVLTFVSELKERKSAMVLYILVFFMGCGLAWLGVQVGSSGGEIRHTELRDTPVENSH